MTTLLCDLIRVVCMTRLCTPRLVRCTLYVVRYNNNNNNNIYLKSNIHSIIRYKFSGLYNGIKHGIHIKTVQCI